MPSLERAPATMLPPDRKLAGVGRPSAAEIAASRLHGHGGVLYTNLDPTPFAHVRRFNGEHILLAQFIDDPRSDHDSVDGRAGEYQLASRPFGEIAQIRGI